MSRSLLVAALLTAVSTVSPAQRAPSDSSEIARIAGLGRMWVTVRFLHPWAAYRADIDIDSSAVEAIAAVRAARSASDFERSLVRMLAALNDPATRVVSTAGGVGQRNRWPVRAGRGDPSAELLQDSTLVISIHRYADVGELAQPEKRVAAVEGMLAGARAVVFDLRTDETPPRTWDDVRAVRGLVERLLRQLTTRIVATPAERRVVRIGFPREDLPGAEVSRPASPFFQTDQVHIVRPDSRARDVPVVLVVNANSELPLYAAALLRDGIAGLVSEGEIGDAPFSRYGHIDAGGGVTVRIRMSEVVDSNGRGVAPPTALITRGTGGGDDSAILRALALVREPWPFRTAPGELLPSLIVHRSPPVLTTPMPPVEARVFAAVKVWGIIANFYPYLDLLDKPWNGVLAEFIPRMRDASSVTEYHLALAEMMSRLQDSHASLITQPLNEWRGLADLPIRMSVIEGRLVVTEVAHDSLLAGARVRRGEVVRIIDGEDALSRAHRIAATGSAATQARMDATAGVQGGRGAVGSTATLVIEDARQQTRTVRLPRHPIADVRADLLRRAPRAVRRIAPDIGYIDVSRVPVDSVDDAFDELRDTRAIILEWREPTGSTFPFVSRLLERDSVPSERPYSRYVGFLHQWAERGTIAAPSFCRCRDTTYHYPGLTALLTGPRAQSSMEHNALILKAANGTPFIGAPTAGTLGATTSFYVPGGIRLVFTGSGTRHLDGSQLQRKGLQPDVPVTVTIAGIRAGRDEVLEAAMAYLKKRLGR